MKNKICLITGATDGIGKAAATALAKMGATVVLGCRDLQRGEATRKEISSITGNSSLFILCADLTSQRSILEMADRFKEKFTALHILVNNAGAVFHRRELTGDEIERTFALNHLAYFLSTRLLLDLMKKSSPARIINVTSATYRYVRFNPDNLQGEIKYSPALAYAQSKLANILFTLELARRLEGTGVTVNCVHPGGIKTKIYQSTPSHRLYLALLGWALKPVEKGAETLVYLASSPEVEGITGCYFQNKQVTVLSRHALDPGASGQLWEISDRLTSCH
jgi:NAD(P)-dependent dehydrogenase (short-subunit alcohol dehydrogenase family)